MDTSTFNLRAVYLWLANIDYPDITSSDLPLIEEIEQFREAIFEGDAVPTLIPHTAEPMKLLRRDGIEKAINVPPTTNTSAAPATATASSSLSPIFTGESVSTSAYLPLHRRASVSTVEDGKSEGGVLLCPQKRWEEMNAGAVGRDYAAALKRQPEREALPAVKMDAPARPPRGGRQANRNTEAGKSAAIKNDAHWRKASATETTALPTPEMTTTAGAAGEDETPVEKEDAKAADNTATADKEILPARQRKPRGYGFERKTRALDQPWRSME